MLAAQRIMRDDLAYQVEVVSELAEEVMQVLSLTATNVQSHQGRIVEPCVR